MFAGKVQRANNLPTLMIVAKKARKTSFLVILTGEGIKNKGTKRALCNIDVIEFAALIL